MIKLKDLLAELQLPKDQYVSLDSSDVEDAKEVLFDLIQTAYAPIGGHLNFKSPNDVLDPELDHWVAADIDADPEIDVTFFGRETPYGIKHTGMGHDGERENIKKLLITKTAELKKPGNYVELSGAAFDSFHGKGGVPIIDDEATVRKVLQKDIEWHGAHPTGTKPGNGWYTRTIGGKPVTKILVGNL